MLKKTTLFITIFLTASHFSQTFSQDAKGNFSQATLAYEAGKYKEALFYLGESERSSGSTNPKIQSLKTLCYYEQGDNKTALVELTRYFRSVPISMQTTEGFKEMLVLQQELIQTNKLAYENQKKYLENAKNNELSKLSTTTKSQTENYEYTLVKESGSIKAMKTFLTKYPATVHGNELKNKISSINADVDFNNLVLKGDQAMLNRIWDIARINYTRALLLKQDKSVEIKLKQCNQNQYIELLLAGDRYAEDKAWYKAIENYEAATNVLDKPEAQQKLENAQDNYAFYNAAKNDEISGYLKYLEEFENGIYSKTTQDILIGKYLNMAERESRLGNSSAVETTLETVYKYHYSRIWPHYKQRYFDIMRNEAEKLTKGSKQKRIENVNQSIRLYEKLNIEFSPKYTSVLSKQKRKETRWQREDYTFIGWHADQINLYGLMMGALKNRKIGMYFSGRTGAGIFESEAYWETDNNNSISESIDKKKIYTGITKSKTIYASIGVTKKIIHPLWLYVGGGVCINSELKVFEQTQTKELEYAVNVDSKFTAPNADAGIFLKLGPVVLQYGISKPFSDKFTENFMQHFGLAISL